MFNMVSSRLQAVPARVYPLVSAPWSPKPSNDHQVEDKQSHVIEESSCDMAGEADRLTSSALRSYIWLAREGLTEAHDTTLPPTISRVCLYAQGVATCYESNLCVELCACYLVCVYSTVYSGVYMLDFFFFLRSLFCKQSRLICRHVK